MKILHLLSGGNLGGIEVLCRDISDYSGETNEFCYLFSGGQITEYMKEKNRKVYELFKINKIRRFFSFFRLIKENDYDATIVHHEGFGIYLFYLFAQFFFKKKKYIRYIHSAYDETVLMKNRRIYDFIYKKMIHRTLIKSDIIVAVSKFVKNSFVEAFQLNEKKVCVIYNGIVVPESTELVEHKGSTTTLLYIGRVASGKGLPGLIRTIKEMKDSQIPVLLTIVGDGNVMEECVTMVDQLQLQDSVIFEGYQMEKERYYADSQIFVYPSVVKEAFGISIVEAMARGNLVVARNVGGIPELLQDGSNGFLFQEDSELKEVLIHVIRERAKDELQTIRKNAIRCAGEYDIVNTVTQLDRTVREVVKGQASE